MIQYLFCIVFVLGGIVWCRELPYPKDRDIQYNFRQDSADIGFCIFRIHDTTVNFQPAFVLKESLSISTPQLRQTGVSHLLMDFNGRPLVYRGILLSDTEQFPNLTGEFKYDFVFRGRNVDIKTVRNGALIQDLTAHVEDSVSYCFENNKFGQFAVMAFFISDILGGEVAKKAFHVNSGMLFDVKFKLVKSASRMIRGKAVPYRRVEFFLNDKRQGEIWISKHGRILKDIEQNGKLVIEPAAEFE